MDRKESGQAPLPGPVQGTLKPPPLARISEPAPPRWSLSAVLLIVAGLGAAAHFSGLGEKALRLIEGRQVESEPTPVASGGPKTLQLAALQLDPGPIDGLLDPASEQALRAFEEMAGLPVTGKPTRELLEEIRAVALGRGIAAPGN